MHDRKRLLIILNRFVIGGQAVDTFPLAYFLQQDFDVLIAYGVKEEDEIVPTFLQEQYPGLHLKRLTFLKRSINPLIEVAAFFQLLILIVSFKPHIVHTHGAKSGVLGRLAAYISRVPVIVHTFHGHFFHSYFNRRISKAIKLFERFLARFTTGFIVLGPAQFRDLVLDFKVVPVDKCKIIPLGLIFPQHEKAEQHRQSFRMAFNVKTNQVAIGIVGRIVPIKNHRFFVEVVQAVIQQYPGNSPVFFIVGDGELKQQVEEHLQSLNIPFARSISSSCRVVFTSWLPNISEVMSGLDIVALTSLNEGTPLSLLEAQAHGKPVIATNVGGVKDSMVHSVSGFYTERESLNEFVSKLNLLINDADLRKKMGAAGKQFVNSKFSKEREVAETKDFYFSLLAKKGF